MNLTHQQVTDVQVCLGTIHYLYKMARRSNLEFVETVLWDAISAIETRLKQGDTTEEETAALSQVIESDFLTLMEFTEILSRFPKESLPQFIEEVEKNDRGH